ncbi:hypothetical protein [Geobacter sp. DSM 9736]|uniref:hypothetical protein n=1 Tax=Geobacter sp. DSM 9736 TaxID=1277350 RepID=UPI000B504B66|nr:hypothetical protein [Geobacter sp. DSM 9736]SNB47246.1 hypothetical protein SAMN06269301_2724 [Geobacter sp. DSM 9736]
MTQDKDERKRPPLRLVVNNPEKRGNRSKGKEEEQFIPLEELIDARDALRTGFYRGMDRWQTKAYQHLERYLQNREWPYGLDPNHGQLMVLPAAVVCTETAGHGGSPQDELLLFIMEDVTGEGLCLSLETILPYWSDDESIMEEALLYAPIHQYGGLFLEENRHDGLLDLVYRLALPLYPPAPNGKIFRRFFGIAALELADTLRHLAGE